MSRNRDGFGTDIEAVITSFNQGTMILEAVESVCAQTLLPQKIIIIDDGSTDECSIRVLKDIEKKSDLPVPVMIHYQENGGVSSARNAGIDAAKGKYICFVDSDDYVRSEAMRPDRAARLPRSDGHRADRPQSACG